MKYKGYLIEASYYPGSTFKILKDGSIKECWPKRKHLQYYTVVHIESGWKWINELTIKEAKKSIDVLNKIDNW